MRLTALIPVVFCTVALILSFLCLFAGHKEGFMEDYHLMTLNVSAIGQTVSIGSNDDSEPESTLDRILVKIPDRITDRINDEVNERIGQVAERIGIEDWYSMHMMNYCEGQFTPAERPNATIQLSDIGKNITNCSDTQAMYKFDPTAIIQDALNRTTGMEVTLEDLQWPNEIETGVKALNALMGAMFVLYVVSICLIFIALVAAAVGFITSGRLSACLNFLVAVLAFLAIGLASALTTAVMKKGADVINEHGNSIGVEAHWGSKFLALTWAATGCMLVVLIWWVVEFCIGRRSNKRRSYVKGEKGGY